MVTNPSTIRSILRVFAAAAVAIAMAPSAQAQSTWTGAANSTWSDAGNWAGGVPNTTTGTAVFTSSASQTTITNGSRIDLRSLVFQSGALAYNIGPNFGINGTPATITVESGVSNDQTINGNVRNASGTTSTITNNGTGLLNFSGQFLSGSLWTVTFDGPGNITANSIQQSGTGYLFSFVKAGSGTLTINTGLSFAPTGASGAGYYTGSTTINGGVLQLGSGTLSLGSGTGAITFGGGTLRYGSATVDYSSRIRSSGSAIRIDTSTQNVTFASALPASNSGGLTKLGSGTLTLSAANLYTGTTTISAGQLSLSGGDNRLAAASPITITGGVLDLGNRGQSTSGAISFQGGTVQSGTLTSTGGAFDGRAGTVSAILAGSGIGLTKTTSGTLTLTGANTYSGATDVNAGTLAFDRVSALNSSSGIGIAGGAILDYTGGAATLAKNVTVTAGSGTGTIRNTGGGLLTLSGNLSKDNSVLRLTGGAFNVTGTISGATPNASDLLVDGTSTVTLSAVNSYDGPTFVNQASTLIVGINNAIPSNSTVTLGDASSSGTLDLGTFTNQIGGLVFSGSGGTVRMAANQTASPQLSTSSALTLGSNASLDLAGMQTSAGNYRLISSTGLSGTFGSVTGLNSNYVLRYGTVNANEISAQRKAEFGTITATPAVATIITGGSTAFSYTVANATPTDGSTLSFTSSNNANVAGSSTGTAGANATSASISGLFFTGTGVGLNQTGSFTLTDPNAISTTANGSVSVNVLNHSLASFAATDTATKTLDFGSYDPDADSWSGGDGGNGSLAYSIFNIASLGFSNAETAGLNLYEWAFATGDDVFSLGASSFANLAAGGSSGFTATVVSPGGLAEGSYSGTYTLKFRDQQDLSGAADTRNLTVTMNVVVVPEPGAIALAAIGIAAAAWARRRSR